MRNELLWLIPGLPLAAAVIVTLFGRVLKGQSHWPVILAVGGAFAVAISAPITLVGGHEGTALVSTAPVNWFTAGLVNVSVRIVIDPIAMTMLMAITFVGTWIAIFSVGYMHGDPGYPRFFAVLSGFVFSMCGLVLTDNLLVLYAFWEGVGICSYFLIGFWFAKPSAAAAALKSFLVTRVGDASMVLGIFLLWKVYGTLNMDALFAAARQDSAAPPELVTACLLLFGGAVGKSAQFPLHVWLPDAMEGPTPASALIHAATMVTAGVYLVGRCMPLFVLAPIALAVVAAIGAFTALLAALIALTQNDLKRVMAYSTVSQLGFMFAALGSGQKNLAAFAVTAAVFHLLTHAFFKALLFLASGSVMHAMGNVVDMRRIGGLRKVLPATHATFLCGALALAGFPLLSGFWSKDEILAAAFEASHGQDYATLYLIVYAALMLTALLTAFYTFRAYFLTFWGELKVPPEAAHHGHHGDVRHHEVDPDAPIQVHESPAVMTAPLFVLAIGAVLLGVAIGPTHLFGSFIERTPSFQWLDHPEHHANFMLMATSGLLALIGIGAAYCFYVARPTIPRRIANAIPVLVRASQNRFYLDEVYSAIAVGPLNALAIVSRVFDMVVDGMVDLSGHVVSFFGRLLRPIQNGLVQFYALAMVMSLVVFLGILIYRR